ncbi:MAG: hypothetical protein ACXWW0_05730 [Bacteroidia bacterium]
MSLSLKSGKTLESIYGQEWVTRSYCDPKIELQTPHQLVETKTIISETNRKSVAKASAYEYGEDDLMILVSSIAYKKGNTASIKGAAAGALHEMQTRGGIEDFSYINKDTTVSGIASIIQRGTFRKGKDKVNFNNLISAKENKLWQVMVANRSDDVYGKKIRNRVIKSVKIPL